MRPSPWRREADDRRNDLSPPTRSLQQKKATALQVITNTGVFPATVVKLCHGHCEVTFRRFVIPFWSEPRVDKTPEGCASPKTLAVTPFGGCSVSHRCCSPLYARITRRCSTYVRPNLRNRVCRPSSPLPPSFRPILSASLLFARALSFTLSPQRGFAMSSPTAHRRERRTTASAAPVESDALLLSPAQRIALHQVYQLILSFAQAPSVASAPVSVQAAPHPRGRLESQP